VAAQGQGRGRAYTLSKRVYAAFDPEDADQPQSTLRTEEIDRRILALAGGLAMLRRKHVIEALSRLDERQASYALQRLCKQGILVPFASGKGRCYKLPLSIRTFSDASVSRTNTSVLTPKFSATCGPPLCGSRNPDP
jgi:hypothetical protein